MIQIKKLRADAPTPAYATPGSSGMDLCAMIDEVVILNPLQRALIPTGICLEMPLGYEAQIRPRSGLALKNGLTVLNTPGTIDSDYRGEIKVIMINLGEVDFVIEPMMRIAQMVIATVIQPSITITSELSESVRSVGGFGSTGL